MPGKKQVQADSLQKNEKVTYKINPDQSLNLIHVLIQKANANHKVKK